MQQNCHYGDIVIVAFLYPRNLSTLTITTRGYLQLSENSDVLFNPTIWFYPNFPYLSVRIETNLS